MRFTTTVEPPEPMRGLEVPARLVEELGDGKRPRVTVTINGHTWSTRIAIMRGRHLIGLSRANRDAAGVATGDAVEVDLALDTAPVVVVEPEDLTRALDADPAARAAYDRLSHSRRRAYVHAIDGAKKAETRARRIEKALAELREA
ncbi:MAG TPA: YdeI/OmpD-associated family protein [Baekduia sp.]|uniref:YdeI/OmpD-associated family protein n=1 Tax=Baekduia sp. TaxID=2600305 RepID=UPI002D76AAB3|nr:YdeI/OmpD-associated family protein [Baekduia sp.]HET6509997.1 YdeI/OmpD-associated family protein [Baekduia sp.]